jgi:hypothetical protein
VAAELGETLPRVWDISSIGGQAARIGSTSPQSVANGAGTDPPDNLNRDDLLDLPRCSCCLSSACPQHQGPLETDGLFSLGLCKIWELCVCSRSWKQLSQVADGDWHHAAPYPCASAGVPTTRTPGLCCTVLSGTKSRRLSFLTSVTFSRATWPSLDDSWKWPCESAAMQRSPPLHCAP